MNTKRFDAVFQLNIAGAVHGVRKIQGEFDDDYCRLEAFCGKRVFRDDIEGGAITCHACLKAIASALMRKRIQYRRKQERLVEIDDEDDYEEDFDYPSAVASHV